MNKEDNKEFDYSVVFIDALAYSTIVVCAALIIRIISLRRIHSEELGLSFMYLIALVPILFGLSAIGKEKYKKSMIIYSFLLLIILTLFAPVVVHV